MSAAIVFLNNALREACVHVCWHHIRFSTQTGLLWYDIYALRKQLHNGNATPTPLH